MTNWFYVYVFIFGIAVIWIPWLLAHKIRPYFGNKKLKQWLKNKKQKKHIENAIKRISSLYVNTNTHRISKLSRKKHNIKKEQFTYGEVTLLTLAKLLDLAKPKPGEVFYDLGAGGGHTVLMADYCYDFAKCVGIEYLPALYNTCTQKLAEYQATGKANNPAFKSQAAFFHGDFLEYDISDADIVFVNATTFMGNIWDNLVPKLKELKPGTRIILSTLKLNYPEFKMVYCDHEVMSWGLCTIRIYEKI